MANQDYETLVIRDTAILTNSYVETSIRGFNDNLDLADKNQVVLLMDFVIWSLDSLDMIVEFSSDNVNYYQETSMELFWSIWRFTLFEYTFTSTWNYRVSFPIKDRYMKIKVKWTWTTTSSSLKITANSWLS